MTQMATRWNLVVTVETDMELRQFLASEGRAKKGELSKFVEDAVKSRIFQLSTARAKSENIQRPATEIAAAVGEALAWARTP